MSDEGGIQPAMPAIFKTRTPKVFRVAKAASESQIKIRQWHPFLEAYCGQMYEYGLSFITQFKKTNCSYIFDLNQYADINNGLTWGRYDPMTNRMHIGEAAFGDKFDFLKVLFHEGIHAIQYDCCACLHDDLSHPDLPLLALSPLSKIRQFIYIERDAHAKDQLFSSLCEWIDVEDRTEIDAWMCDTAQVEASIRAVALEALTYVGPEVEELTIQESLIDEWLDYYEKSLSWFLENQDRNAQYTSLGPEDVWSLGSALNMNSICASPDEVVLYEPFDLTDLQKERLEAIHLALNIPDEKTLPSFSDALKAYNMTPAQYLELARKVRYETA